MKFPLAWLLWHDKTPKYVILRKYDHPKEGHQIIQAVWSKFGWYDLAWKCLGID